MTTGQDDITQLVAFRRALHRSPELSGHEARTAAEVEAFTQASHPD